MLVIGISITQSSNLTFIGGSITNMQSPSLTFPSFPKLPSELRQMVWSYALLPRVVKFRFRHPPRHRTANEVAETRVFLEATPVAVLQVCREAREVALKSYVNVCSESNPKGAYIDYSCDTLYFEISQVTLKSALSLLDTHQVRFLAVDVDYWCYGPIGDKFTQLKEVIFVVPTPVIGPSKGKTGVILKEIDVDYERKKVYSFITVIETFTDVFERVSQNFGSNRHFLFGPAPRVSLMELNRVQCNRVLSWDLGFALQKNTAIC
jgi:hypothetical protein